MPPRKRKLTQKALELEIAKQGKAKRKSPNKSIIINVTVKKVVETKQKKADTRSISKTKANEEVVVNTIPETKTRSRSAGKKSASKAIEKPTKVQTKPEPKARSRGRSAGKAAANKESEKQQMKTNDVIIPETNTRSRSSGKAAIGKPSVQQTKTKAGSKSSISTNIVTIGKKSEEITSTASKRKTSKKLLARYKVDKDISKHVEMAKVNKLFSKKEANKQSKVPQKRSAAKVATTVKSPKGKKKALPLKAAVNQNTTIVGAIRKRKLETSGEDIIPLKKSRRACRAQIQMPTPKPIEKKSRGSLSNNKTSKKNAINKSTTKKSLEVISEKL